MEDYNKKGLFHESSGSHIRTNDATQAVSLKVEEIKPCKNMTMSIIVCLCTIYRGWEIRYNKFVCLPT